jgi:hypothetical protein
VTEDTERPMTKFVDDSLHPIPADRVIESYQSALNRTRYRIITPTVVEAVRDHFGCPTLRGAPLEDDFGRGSAGSHWDQRRLEGEIMDPVAGQNTFDGRHVITNLTLGLLKDTGWCVLRRVDSILSSCNTRSFLS